MKKTKSLAFCSILTGLGTILMLCTGIFPMMEFTFPAIAGVLLMAVVVEQGEKWGYLCYGAISLLSLILVPVKDAAVFFVLFFGIYPVLKSRLEQMRRRWAEILCKHLFFNAAVIVGLLAVTLLLKLDDYLPLLTQSPLILVLMLLLLNVIFVIYDIALTRIVSVYLNHFRPRYLKRFF